jgi:cytochrome c-type biogenesis protein CcmH/NrfG
MTALAMLAAMVAAQSATSLPGPDIQLIEQKQVAYEALVDGNAERALADLEPRLVQEPEDPALLINLGAAYARLGRSEMAAAAYQAAFDSRTRYHMELADGRWLDSRRVAQMALNSLSPTTRLARR